MNAEPMSDGASRRGRRTALAEPRAIPRSHGLTLLATSSVPPTSVRRRVRGAKANVPPFSSVTSVRPRGGGMWFEERSRPSKRLGAPNRSCREAAASGVPGGIAAVPVGLWENG
jgi:hypothetical protein